MRFRNVDGNRKRTSRVPGPYCLPYFYNGEKILSNVNVVVCKSKLKIAHFRFPSASQKRTCISSPMSDQISDQGIQKMKHNPKSQCWTTSHNVAPVDGEAVS